VKRIAVTDVPVPGVGGRIVTAADSSSVVAAGLRLKIG